MQSQAVGAHSVRDLMPSIVVETCWAIGYWGVYFCKKVLGFDILFLFHRGDATSREYFGFAIGFTALAVLMIGVKYRKARILHQRGAETVGTVADTLRRYRGTGWDVKVAYAVDGAAITIVQRCTGNRRPVVGEHVPVIYDAQKPVRARVEFISK